MKPKMYINEILYRNNLTINELSEITKISKNTLLNLLYERTNNISPKIAKQIGSIDGRKDYEIIYEVFADQAYEYGVAESELLYLSQLYCSGFLIDFNYCYKFGLCKTEISSLAAKLKRSGHKFSIIEDWNKLTNDYLKTIFCEAYSNGNNYNKLFKSEETFLNSVLYYGISKVQSISKDPVINYVLLINDRDVFRKIEGLLPYKSSININLIHVDFDKLVPLKDILHPSSEQLSKLNDMVNQIDSYNDNNKEIYFIKDCLIKGLYVLINNTTNEKFLYYCRDTLQFDKYANAEIRQGHEKQRLLSYLEQLQKDLKKNGNIPVLLTYMSRIFIAVGIEYISLNTYNTILYYLTEVLNKMEKIKEKK